MSNKEIVRLNWHTLEQSGVSEAFLTLSEVKSYLKACGTFDDDLIQSFMSIAVSEGEALIDYAIGNKIFTVTYLKYICNRLILPHKNIVSIESIETIDCSSVQQLQNGSFSFNNVTQILCLNQDIHSEAIVIKYRTEILKESSLYERLKHAQLEHVNTLFKDRNRGPQTANKIASLYNSFTRLL